MRMRVSPSASLLLLSASLVFLGNCAVERLDAVPEAGSTRATFLTERSGSDIDLDFLLSMSFVEAASMTSQTMAVPPFFRVAADEILHDPVPEGRQLSAFRAKGSVYLEIDYGEEVLVAICDDADVNMGRVVLRGMPALRRGLSVIEAAADETIFYITRDDVSATGPHLLREVGDTSGAMMAMDTNPLLPSPEGEMLDDSQGLPPMGGSEDPGTVEEVELDPDTMAMLEAQGVDFSDTGLPGTDPEEVTAAPEIPAPVADEDASTEEAKPKKKGILSGLFSSKKKEEAGSDSGDGESSSEEPESAGDEE